MTDIHGNLLWCGEYTAWGRLKEEAKVTDSAYQPFNTNAWFDPLGLKKKRNKKPRRIIPYDDIMDDVDKRSLVPVSQRQKCLIKDKLPSVKQRSVRQNRMMVKTFLEDKKA